MVNTIYDKEFPQTLEENLKENMTQEFMSLIDKEMSGLPVIIVVDDMNSWAKIGNYRRIKFQGNKRKYVDYNKIYSMSIERNPRILVKDAPIKLTEEELQKVKDFVSKNRKHLIRLAKTKISYNDFAVKLGYLKRKKIKGLNYYYE